MRTNSIITAIAATSSLITLFAFSASAQRLEGTIVTVAGAGLRGPWEPGVRGFKGDGGPAVEAWLDAPSGVAVDQSGNVYIADTLNDRVRKIDSTGIIRTIAGTGIGGYSGDGGPATAARISNPMRVVAGRSGVIYILEGERIRKVDTNGVITTIAGRKGSRGFSGDGGPASDADLGTPFDIAMDKDGNLFTAEVYNSNERSK